MKILGHRVLIAPINSDKSSGGIFLPDAASPDRVDQEGIVMAIGSGIREDLPYRKGSHVFIEMYKAQAQEILVKGMPARFIEQSAIVGALSATGAFYPIGDKILLKPIKTVCSGSKIIRPSAYEHGEDELMTCTVHLLGNGVRNKRGEYWPFEVKVGDLVLIKPFAGRDVDTNECTFKLVKQSDIEAIYE